ncbi:MAG TPA: hypothetical protein VFG54_15230 [Prolixibacteraceae bacterium]|nr:hypothetical protein [Prolixibacteraceae bacterium]
MKNLLIVMIALMLMASCKKDTTYQMQILIKNNTDNTLKVTLFPRTKYMDGNLYDSSDIGGGYAQTTFDIESNSQEGLYISGNLNQKPYNLAKEVFDSIRIISDQNETGMMRFSNDQAVGYPDNLFSDQSTWDFEKRNVNLHTQFSAHPVESHDYTFVISQ